MVSCDRRRFNFSIQELKMILKITIGNKVYITTEGFEVSGRTLVVKHRQEYMKQTVQLPEEYSVELVEPFKSRN